MSKKNISYLHTAFMQNDLIGIGDVMTKMIREIR